MIKGLAETKISVSPHRLSPANCFLILTVPFPFGQILALKTIFRKNHDFSTQEFLIPGI